MLISVIITTKNEDKNIANCLQSIENQTYPKDKIEIIVVDNNSADKTKEIARNFTNNVYNYGPERSAQRNEGVNLSTGDYFIYLDADMILEQNVISECVDVIKPDKAIVGLYIPEIVIGKKFLSKVRRFERSFYDGTVIDCARFIKKSAFELAKGFDLNFTGPEDWDLDKKLRNIGKLKLIKSPIYHNEEEIQINKYLNKKGYYAKSFDNYIAKWGKSDGDIKKQFGFYYRFLGVFIENNKWKKLFKHPMLTFGMYFLRILVGVKFLCRK